MRHLLAPLAFFACVAVATAADPPGEAASKASAKYITALGKTAEVLKNVTDDTTAADAKPKLDNLHEEARDARKQMFKALSELDIPDGEFAGLLERMPKILRQIDGDIVAEFDRIGGNKKSAYKLLRETKLFAGLEKGYEEKATMGALMLEQAARSFTLRSGGKAPPKPDDLAAYLDTGKKALTDPWGFPYQLLTKPAKDNTTRTYCWTVSPYTGKKLGTPPPDEKDK